jgi:predicted Fe-Mo cluster-binding NifX family protein
MKLAFPATGSDLDGLLDGRFGRAARFLIVDPESGAFEVVENGSNAEASQGAGIQSAQTVVASGAGALVSSHCGPKAFKVLQAAKIPVLQAPVASIVELLAKYKAGELAAMAGPDNAGRAG